MAFFLFSFLSKHICFDFKTPMFRFQNTGVLNLTDRMQIYKRLIDSNRPGVFPLPYLCIVKSNISLIINLLIFNFSIPMPLIYTLVKRKDMSKDAASGATLYHAQTSITKKLTLNKICTRIENICTASRGEIILVLDGLIKVMNEALSDGESVHLGEFGSFRMVAGSKGSNTVDGFNTALFNRAHIVFYPGTMLINLVNNVSFERYVPKKDASSESSGGGGEDDRPGEL